MLYIKRYSTQWILLLIWPIVVTASTPVDSPDFSCAVPAGPGFQDSIRIMTYNVHHCNPPGKATQGVIDIPAIVKAIRSQQPDLVALQEIDVNTTRSGKEINEAAAIAEALGMYFYFGKAIDYGGGGYGVAILSRFPLSETRTQWLSQEADPKTERRVLATARVTIPGGKQIRFASTHLDVENAANRLLQVQQIAETARQDSIPFILAGDLNDRPGSQPLSLLATQLQLTCDPCMPTFPQDLPTEVIDFIAFSPKTTATVISHFVVPEIYASDHRPLMAVLLFR